MSPSPRYESRDVDPSPVAQPLHFEFSSKTAPNRFLKAAMTERLSSWSPTDFDARGIPSKNLINVYKRWGEGESGVILIGNTMIYSDQLEAAGNPIIPNGCPFSGPRFDAFKEMATAAKKHGSLCVMQLSHPGRQTASNLQPNPVSASDVQLEGNVMGMTFAQPHAASLQEIDDIVGAFAHAAEFAHKSGYDGVELHGAHGYLLAQFLAQTTNKRTDEYGGSIQNRARIITRIATEIRSRLPASFILGVKLNSVEFQAGGLSPSEAKEVVALLEQHKFDFIELSGGTYEHLAFSHQRESSKKREAFFLEFAEQITPSLSKTRTYVTGGFKTLSAMVDAMNSANIDGVGLARPVCQEPRLPKDIIEGRVRGAVHQLFPEEDFAITNIVAGSQIRQIGKDEEPMDGSKPQNADAFKQDMGKWMEAMGQNTSGEKYGYVDIESIPSVPYATAAPTTVL